MIMQRTQGPRAEPLHLDEVKAHLRVEHADDDTRITTLIGTAREHVEEFLARQLCVATWTLKRDGFPSAFELPRPPLIEVDSITYVDTAGVTQTVTTSVYTVLTNREPGKVIEAYGQTWPSSVRGHTDDVAVAYKAGYAVPFTAVAATDVLTFLGLNPTDGDVYRLRNSAAEDGTLPGGLSADTDYYVISASGATCKFSTSPGGSAVDITSTGDGQSYAGIIPEPILSAMKLLIGGWYEHPEAQGEKRIEDNPAAGRLLWPYRMLDGL